MSRLETLIQKNGGDAGCFPWDYYFDLRDRVKNYDALEQGINCIEEFREGRSPICRVLQN